MLYFQCLLACLLKFGHLRQDVTPVNPLGGVDGFVKASAHGGGEDIGGGRALDGQDGWATGVVWEGTRGLLLGLGTGVGGGVSPAVHTWSGGMQDCLPARILRNCFWCWRCLRDISNVRNFSDSHDSNGGRTVTLFLGEVQPLKDFFILER